MGVHQARGESLPGWDTMLYEKLGELAARSSDQQKRICHKEKRFITATSGADDVRDTWGDQLWKRALKCGMLL